MSDAGIGHTTALYGSAASSMSYSGSLGHSDAPMIGTAEGHAASAVPSNATDHGPGLMASCAYTNYYTKSLYSWCNY